MKKKVAIIGSRSFNDYEFLKEKLNPDSISIIVSGGAFGADELAEQYAEEHEIPMRIFKPNWKLGKHAGLLRNIEIVDFCDFVIAFWNGKSKGTKHAIEYAKKIGKEVVIYEIV